VPDPIGGGFSPASEALELNPAAAVLSYMTSKGYSVPDLKGEMQAPVDLEGGAPSFAVGLGRKLAEVDDALAPIADAEDRQPLEPLKSLVDIARDPVGELFDKRLKMYQMGDRDYSDPIRPNIVDLLRKGRSYEEIDSEIGMPAGSAKKIHLGPYAEDADESLWNTYDRFIDNVSLGLDKTGSNVSALALGIPAMLKAGYEGIAAGYGTEEMLTRGGEVLEETGKSFVKSFAEPGKSAREEGSLLMASNQLLPLVKPLAKFKGAARKEAKALRDEMFANANEMARAATTQGGSMQGAVNRSFAVNKMEAKHADLVKKLRRARGKELVGAVADLAAIAAGHPLGPYDLATSVMRYLGLADAYSSKGASRRALLLDPSERRPDVFNEILRERLAMRNTSELALHDVFSAIPERMRPTAQVHLHMEHVNAPQVVLPSGKRIYQSTSENNLIGYYKPDPSQPGQYKLTPEGEAYVKTGRAKQDVNGRTDVDALNQQIELANRYSRPMADLITEASRKALDLGLVGDKALQVYFPNLWDKFISKDKLGFQSYMMSAERKIGEKPLFESPDASALRRNKFREASKRWEKDNPGVNPELNPFSLDARIKKGMTSDFAQEVFTGVANYIDMVNTYEFYKKLAESDLTMTKKQLDSLKDLAAKKRERAEADGISKAERKTLIDEATTLSELADSYMPADPPRKIESGGPSSPPEQGHLQGVLKTGDDGVKRWKLRNQDEQLYVQGDTYLEYKNLEKFKEDMANRGAKLYQLWKGVKTVGSPLAHVRNGVGMLLYIAPMAGVSIFNPKNLKYYKQAISDLSKPIEKRSEAFKDAFRSGALGGSVLQDLPVYKGELRPLQGGNLNSLDLAKAWMGMFTKPGKAVGTTVEAATRLYGATDDVGRLAFFYKNRDMLKKSGGATRSALMRVGNETREKLIDYKNLPNYAEVLRAPVLPYTLANGQLRTMMPGVRSLAYIMANPFIAFGRQSLRQERNFRNNHPVRVAMYQNLLEALTRQNQVAAGLDPDLESASTHIVPDMLRGKTMPLAAFGPEYATGQNAGKLQFGGIDPEVLASNMVNHFAFASVMPVGIPASDNMVMKVAKFLKNTVSGESPVLGPFLDLVYNEDPFTGRKIFEEGEPTTNSLVKALNYMVKKVGPTWTPSTEPLFGPLVVDPLYKLETGRERGEILGDPKIEGGTLVKRLSDAYSGKVLPSGDVVTPDRIATEFKTGGRTEGLRKRDMIMKFIGREIGGIKGIPKDILAVEKLPKSAGEARRGVDSIIDALADSQVARAADRMPMFIRTLKPFADLRLKGGGATYPEAFEINEIAKRFYVAAKYGDKEEARDLLKDLLAEYRAQAIEYRDYTGERVEKVLRERGQ
jgi:hypothetical protein